MAIAQKMRSLTLTALAVAVLAACSGGNDGAIQEPAPIQPTAEISGTAAGGAPVAGVIDIKDSLGATKTVDIAADGSYSIDATGMTAPFMIRATGTVGGTSVAYYSAATAADLGNKVNVTPLTTLLVSNVAMGPAESHFNAGRFSGFTDAKLIVALANLQKKLAPALEALGLTQSIDLLHEPFKADHTGLDAALDMIKVSIDPTTNVATLINARTKSVIGKDNLNSESDDSDAQSLPEAEKTLLGTGQTEIKKIKEVVSTYADKFASGLPSPEGMIASGIFDATNFMFSGQSVETFLSSVTYDDRNVGMKVVSSDISFSASEPYLATAKIVLELKNGARQDIEFLLRQNDAGHWRIVGNGKVAFVAITPYAAWTPKSTATSPTMQAGLQAKIQVNMSTGINKAVVTGAGIRPAAGIALGIYDDPYHLSLNQYGENVIPECLSQNSTNCIDLDVATDNASYNVKLYADITGTVPVNDNGYDIVIAKKPVSAFQLTSDMFMNVTDLSIDGIAVTGLSQFQPSKDLSAAWTKPAKFDAKELKIVFGFANGTGTQSDALVDDSTSTVVSIGGGADGADSARLSFAGRDNYKRTFVTKINFYKPASY